MRNVQIQPANKLKSADLSFPGDKSLSHRAIIFGSLADGKSHFTNVLSGEDCVCTRRAFEAMGVSITSKNDSELWVEGKGFHSLRQPSSELYLGNSGTSMRLLMGLLSGQKFNSVLTGDPSLSNRPMKRAADPLRAMGAVIDGRDGGNFAPIRITGSELRGVYYDMPISSAQVKSALLLAGLYAKGKTTVTEPEKSRDHTERFIKYFGVDLDVRGNAVTILPGKPMQAKSFEIAGDISSAAFFMAASVLFPSADIKFRSVLWNPTRIGIVHVLKRMGVEVIVSREYFQGPEPVADFCLRTTSLRPFEIFRSELPMLIDEIPILAVLATQASGRSVIHDADELRVKETDRIASMTELLTRMGAKVEVSGNTMAIEGPAKLCGAVVDSKKDHRTAMSGMIAALVAQGITEVHDVECVNTSFPGFFELLTTIGVSFRVIDTP